jgi:hypothetical protein
LFGVEVDVEPKGGVSIFFDKANDGVCVRVREMLPFFVLVVEYGFPTFWDTRGRRPRGRDVVGHRVEVVLTMDDGRESAQKDEVYLKNEGGRSKNRFVLCECRVK